MEEHAAPRPGGGDPDESSTAPVPAGLRARTLHGVSWSFLERASQFGIQFAISVILARLLLPSQFGLVAMLSFFIAVAQTLVDSGFGQALIQKRDVTAIDESSAFYFNVTVGVVMAGLVCLAAPGIAAFYKTPPLAPMARVLSLSLVFGAFGVVQAALRTRRVDFRRQMVVSTVATAASGLVGVTMALLGFGAWSLVAQSLCASAFRSILYWLVFSWRPVLAFSFRSLRNMFSYGSRLLLSGLLDTLYNNVYLLVIGRAYSPADLGFYSRALGIQQVPVTNITYSVSRVTFPVYAAIQDDKARLKRGVRESLKTVTLVTFPLMVGLAVCARPLVRVLLTDKWLPSVPYLQLLCLAGMLVPLHSVNLNVLKAQGRSGLYFGVELAKKAIAVVALIATYHRGITAIILGQLASSALGYWLNSAYTGRMLAYPLAEQVTDLLPNLGLAVGVGAAMSALTLLPVRSQALLLAMQVCLGIGLYLLLCWRLRLPSFMLFAERIGPRLRSFVGVRSVEFGENDGRLL